MHTTKNELQNIFDDVHIVVLFAVHIGYIETHLSVSESESDISLAIELMEGIIAPELGSIVVAVSTQDLTASGAP